MSAHFLPCHKSWEWGGLLWTILIRGREVKSHMDCLLVKDHCLFQKFSIRDPRKKRPLYGIWVSLNHRHDGAFTVPWVVPTVPPSSYMTHQQRGLPVLRYLEGNLQIHWDGRNATVQRYQRRNSILFTRESPCNRNRGWINTTFAGLDVGSDKSFRKNAGNGWWTLVLWLHPYLILTCPW